MSMDGRGIIVLVVSLVAEAHAKKAAVAEVSNNMMGDVIDLVKSLVTETWQTSFALATDGVALVLSLPSLAVDLYAWSAGQVRASPDMIKNIVRGEAGTLESLASFASDMASIIFCVYAALTALNLALGVGIACKDYIGSYLELPKSLPGVKKLPAPVLKARNMVQSLLDRIKGLGINGWIVPLEGQTGKPSLSEALSVLASATSVCVFLGCAPAIHSIIQKGADKKAAEDLAYTLGMAVGLLYLVKKVN